jgi:hypothetical protein
MDEDTKLNPHVGNSFTAKGRHILEQSNLHAVAVKTSNLAKMFSDI